VKDSPEALAYIKKLSEEDRPRFTIPYTVLKNKMGSSEKAFKSMMSLKDAPTNMQDEVYYDAKAENFMHAQDSPEDKKEFNKEYTELKQMLGSSAAAYQAMLSDENSIINRIQRKNMSDTTPVSANAVPSSPSSQDSVTGWIDSQHQPTFAPSQTITKPYTSSQNSGWNESHQRTSAPSQYTTAQPNDITTTGDYFRQNNY
jgi:hypothetical protein